MLIAMAAITAIAVSAVIAATALISLASVREDARWTLGEPATSRIEKAARRILRYHSDTTRHPVPHGHAPAWTCPHGPRREAIPGAAPAITGQADAHRDYAA